MPTEINCNGIRYVDVRRGAYDGTWLSAYYSKPTSGFFEVSALIMTRFVYYPLVPFVDLMRFSQKFDTRLVPAGAYISNVKLCGDAYCNDTNPLAISASMKFYRETSPPNDIVVGSPGSLWTEWWEYIGDLGILLGSVYIPYHQLTPVAVEIELGGVGIASIVKGGYTYIGCKIAQDSPTPPTPTTRAGLRMDNCLLKVTYSTEEELVVVTLPATEITKESLTVEGEITKGAATKRGFDWGEASDALINEWYEEGTYGTGEFSHELTGLTPGQHFCHRAKAAT